MTSNTRDELSFLPEPDEPHTASATGAGSGPRRPTAVGSGDNDAGGNYGFNRFLNEDNRPVPHRQLKDLAIDALANCSTKNYASVKTTLLRKLTHLRSDAAEDLASALASLVTTAYTVANCLPVADAEQALLSAFPNFQTSQLRRIAHIAQTRGF